MLDKPSAFSYTSPFFGNWLSAALLGKDGSSTPKRSGHMITVRTPSGSFLPADSSTPTMNSQQSVKCPQTPVEIRKFLTAGGGSAGG